MAEQQLTQTEIDTLADKLDQLAQGLTATELAVLLGIFARARASLVQDARHASGTGDEIAGYAVTLVEPGREAPLADGFRDVFAAGGAGGIVGDDTTSSLMISDIGIPIQWQR